MTNIWNWLKEGLTFLAFSLLLIAGTLLFAVLVRPLMILAIAATVGVAVFSLFSPGVRRWLESPSRS